MRSGQGFRSARPHFIRQSGHCGANRLYPKEEPIARKVVGQGGLEPPTSRLSSARSNQLSYKPSDRAIETKSRKAALLKEKGYRGLCRTLAERLQPTGQ